MLFEKNTYMSWLPQGNARHMSIYHSLSFIPFWLSLSIYIYTYDCVLYMFKHACIKWTV